MAEETHYKANTGIATIGTGTSSMTGGGSTLLLAAGAAAAGFNGTLLKKVTIKSTAVNEDSIVRLFVKDKGSNYILLTEINIAKDSPAAINEAYEFEATLNFSLQPDYSIYASVSMSNNFNIIAEALDWSYYAASVRPDTTQYTANIGIASAATANPNLDGTTGTYVTVYTAGSSATYKGSSIGTITCKATVNNTPGMIRLFINNGSTNYLFHEVVVPSITKTATDNAFEYTIVFENNFDLKAGYIIKASVERAENFNIMVEGKDWNYAA